MECPRFREVLEVVQPGYMSDIVCDPKEVLDDHEYRLEEGLW